MKRFFAVASVLILATVLYCTPTPNINPTPIAIQPTSTPTITHTATLPPTLTPAPTSTIEAPKATPKLIKAKTATPKPVIISTPVNTPIPTLTPQLHVTYTIPLDEWLSKVALREYGNVSDYARIITNTNVYGHKWGCSYISNPNEITEGNCLVLEVIK